MIKIAQDRDLGTLINAFRATQERWGASGNHFRCDRSKDGTRVVNFAPGKSAGNWEKLFRIGSESRFRETTECAKPNAPLYEVCYVLDKTGQPGR